MTLDSKRAGLVDSNWAALVQDVTSVLAIAEELRVEGMLNWEPYCRIRAEKTNQDKMREFGGYLHSGGDKVKSAFYSALEKHEPALLGKLEKYKNWIKLQNKFVSEYNSLPGESVLLSERYTKPTIIMRHKEKREREEQISTVGQGLRELLVSRNTADDECSILDALFMADAKGNCPRCVLLQGNSGNGKSVTCQKVMLDWATGRVLRDDFEYVFHLKCKELTCVCEERSLVELLSFGSNLTVDQILSVLLRNPEHVLLLIDGFDELKLSDDERPVLSTLKHPTDKAEVKVLLKALLRGQILPESFLLVTTRSTGTHTLTSLLKPPQRFTEMMGFSEKGVEEYFQKFFQDDELSRKAFERVKANETLFTSCSIPVICWIVCTVMREKFSDGGDPTSGRETTTSIYVDFVFTLLEHHCRGLNQSVRSLLESLGRLAERGLLDQQVLMEEKTVQEVVSEPADSPFLCKFLFKRRVQQETMFSFMHLSFQEFPTALYYVCLEEDQARVTSEALLSGKTIFDSLDLPRYPEVLLFVFGLVNNDVMLRFRSKDNLAGLQNTTAILKKYLLKEVQSNPKSDRVLFVLHCLYEVHDDDFVRDVMGGWSCIDISRVTLRRSDCWALLYCAQHCRVLQKLVAFGCGLTSDKLRILLPVLHKFKELRLSPENISDDDVAAVMRVFSETQTLGSQSVSVDLIRGSKFRRNLSRIYIFSIRMSFSHEDCSINLAFNPFAASLKTVYLTFPRSELISVDWRKFFLGFNDEEGLMSVHHSVSDLRAMEISVSSLNTWWSEWSLHVSEACGSLTELTVEAEVLLEEGIQILRRSQLRPGCTITFKGWRCSKPTQKCTEFEYMLMCNQRVKISLSSRSFTEENL